MSDADAAENICYDPKVVYDALHALIYGNIYTRQKIVLSTTIALSCLLHLPL